MLEQWRAKRGLQKVLRARDRDYAKERASLRKQDDYYEWLSGWDGRIIPARDDYEGARTSDWRRKAVGRLVELPSRREQDGYWRQTHDTGEWVLTDRGVAYIRSAVRQEELASSEMGFRRLHIVLSVAALVISAFSAALVIYVAL